MKTIKIRIPDESKRTDYYRIDRISVGCFNLFMSSALQDRSLFSLYNMLFRRNHIRKRLLEIKKRLLDDMRHL